MTQKLAPLTREECEELLAHITGWWKAPETDWYVRLLRDHVAAMTHIEELRSQLADAHRLLDSTENKLFAISRACLDHDHPVWAIEDVQVIAKDALAELEARNE